MKILIVEPNGSGHHLALYVRHVVHKLVEEKCVISLLTTRSATAHSSFKLLEKYKDKINLHYLPELPLINGVSAFKLFMNQIKSWFVLQQEFKKINAKTYFDVVYISTVDWVIKATEVLGSPFYQVPFVALYMSPKHHRKSMGLGPVSRQDWLYKKMFQRLLTISTLRNILVIDEFFFDYCKQNYGLLAKKVKYVPDFGEVRGAGTKEECRDHLRIPLKCKLLLVYGSLTKRKGIIQLIKAIAHPDSPKDLKVIIAGKIKEDIKSFFTSPIIKKMIEEKRIFLRLYFHNDEDEYRVFKATDYVWLGYIGGSYGSSGVLYQALHAGATIVSMEDGLIGKIVKKYKLGVTVNPACLNSVLQGLNRISLNQHLRFNNDNIALKKFMNTHRSEIHSTKVFEALFEK